MKKRYNAYIGILCSLLVFTGCDKESVTPYTEEKVPITLSASSLPVSVDIQTQTRATETINNRSIGIVAAKATGSALSNVTSWTDYYLDHVRATGTDTDLNGEKEVVFAPLQYWPFNPGEYLAFVAYSPFHGTNGDVRVARVGETNTLKVTANSTESFPDFLYTKPVGAFNKETAKANTDKAVSLGEFQHAMAKLDIEVKLVDKDGNDIEEEELPDPNPLKITKLEISTKVDNGIFALPENSTIAPTWSLGTQLTVAKSVYTPVSSASPETLATPLLYTCLLLPNTESDSFVSITVSDGVGEVKLESKEISGFKAILPSTEVKLEMGKTTKLTIKVKYVPIPDPETDIILEGQLVEWDYKGKSTVTIE